MRYFIFLGCVLSATLVSAAESWRPLFNGQDLAGWETYLAKPDKAWDVPGLKRDDKGNYAEPIGKNYDPLKVFVVENVDGPPAIHISGQGFGTVTTTESFTNYHLRLQIKWGEKRWGSRANAKRDSGLLYLVHGEPGAVSGNWPRSIEFQIQEHDMGDLYPVGTQITVLAHQEKTNLWYYDPKGEPTVFARNKRCVKLGDAEKPNGEWNALELICYNGDSIHIVNGKVVMRLSNAKRVDGKTPEPLTSGAISLQTEGAEVFYRDVEIRPIAKIPAEFVTH